MLRRLLPFSVLLLLILAPQSLFATTFWPKVAPPDRIISLSPHSTEILFALGLGDHVVAVSDYCDYPPAANLLPKVGGLIAPQLERIVQLQADLVILLSSQHTIANKLTAMGFNTLMVDNRRLDDINNSIVRIAAATGQQAKGVQLLSSLQHHIEQVQQGVQTLPKPRVLISLSHPDTTLDTIYIAGQHDFYHDLLLIAGAENAYPHPHPAVPHLSLEGVASLNPDIIIDIFPEPADHQANLPQIRQLWQQLDGITAVKKEQIYLFEADYATIPGPRIGLLLQQLARFIHPDIDWPDSASTLP